MSERGTSDLLSAGAALLDEAVELRRRLHRTPELGLELPETQAAVLGALDGLPLTVTTGTTTSSVVAVLGTTAADKPVLGATMRVMHA